MSKRILLVDDDPDFIEINQLILESSGYKIESASSTSEALEKIKSADFDLAIIDLIMEELDSGFSVAYGIRDFEKTRDMPILMLTSAQEKTGFNFELSRDQEWMKVDDFAAKPLGSAELLKRVEQLIGDKN
ncbi:response regulator [candidate division KSB1 bacterium]|nr:MAG: response regulator [candidate division KSB1 bacterium]